MDYTFDQLFDKILKVLYDKAISEANDKQVNLFSLIHAKEDTYWNQILLRDIIDDLENKKWARVSKADPLAEIYIITYKGIEICEKYKSYSEYKKNHDRIQRRENYKKSAQYWFGIIIPVLSMIIALVAVGMNAGC